MEGDGLSDMWMKALFQYGVPSIILAIFIYAAGKWGTRFLDAHLSHLQAMTSGLVKIVERIDTSDSSTEMRFASLRLEILGAIETAAKETRHAAANNVQTAVGWITRAIDSKTHEEYIQKKDIAT